MMTRESKPASVRWDWATSKDGWDSVQVPGAWIGRGRNKQSPTCCPAQVAQQPHIARIEEIANNDKLIFKEVKLSIVFVKLYPLHDCSQNAFVLVCSLDRNYRHRLVLGIAWIVSRKLRTNVASSPASEHDNTALTAATDDDEDPQDMLYKCTSREESKDSIICATL
jgi:hypothetical protein